MDTKVELCLERAKNEYDVARIMFEVSQNKDLKLDFGVDENETYYSTVISHCYYSIFYAAKALLLTKSVETDAPEVHKKTFEEFKKNFVDTGELDVALLKIYRKMITRAEELLGLYKSEKKKRGHFTYKTLPQANINPAEDSLENAKKFVMNINEVIKQDNKV